MASLIETLEKKSVIATGGTAEQRADAVAKAQAHFKSKGFDIIALKDASSFESYAEALRAEMLKRSSLEEITPMEGVENQLEEWFSEWMIERLDGKKKTLVVLPELHLLHKAEPTEFFSVMGDLLFISYECPKAPFRCLISLEQDIPELPTRIAFDVGDDEGNAVDTAQVFKKHFQVVSV